MSHTPGPWAWGGDYGQSELSAPGGKKVIDYAAYEGMWLATYDAGTDAANARLIAAAPDLLAFAAAFVELDWLISREDIASGIGVLLKQARAAIAKAEP